MDPSTDKLLQRALVMAPIRKDADLTRQVLARAEIEATTCADVDELCREIVRGAGVVILAQEVLSDHFLECLRGVVEKQPPWSDLPIIVLTRASEPIDPLIQQVAPLAAVTFLERPVRMSTLLSAANAALRARRRQMEIRDFSRRKDEFLAMLGHELRNPLGAIQNAVSILHGDSLAAERTAKARLVIERQLGNLGRIVDDILDVSRVTTGKVVLDRRVIDLNELLHRWLQAYGDGKLVRDHSITLSLPAEPIHVNADAVRLEQVLSNLLSNAVKYTPAGGRIEVALTRDRDEAVIAVRDDGVGIDPAMLPRVFELFTQAEVTLARSRGGLGLGLALVRSLVQLHGGTVSATSDGVGKGSQFVVRLPRVAAPLHLVDESPEQLQPAPLRIVLVEDNDDACETLKLVLEFDGHEVQTANDGVCGRDLILASKPDVALVDIGLPELDGYEIARQVKSVAGAERPVLIAMTGYGQPEDRQKAIEAGFDEHLVKPLQPQLLNRVLAKRANRQQAVAQRRNQ